jgi:hypothetical protein
MVSVSPASSEQEKGVYKSEPKTAYADDVPVYEVGGGAGESNEVEFTETKELR